VVSFSVLGLIRALSSIPASTAVTRKKNQETDGYGRDKRPKTEKITTGKHVGSACYNKEKVCIYLQPFSR